MFDAEVNHITRLQYAHNLAAMQMQCKYIILYAMHFECIYIIYAMQMQCIRNFISCSCENHYYGVSYQKAYHSIG